MLLKSSTNTSKLFRRFMNLVSHICSNQDLVLSGWYSLIVSSATVYWIDIFLKQSCNLLNDHHRVFLITVIFISLGMDTFSLWFAQCMKRTFGYKCCILSVIPETWPEIFTVPFRKKIHEMNHVINKKKEKNIFSKKKDFLSREIFLRLISNVTSMATSKTKTPPQKKV